MIGIPYGMLRLKINIRSWCRFHEAYDREVGCVWDEELNLEGVKYGTIGICKVFLIRDGFLWDLDFL